MTTDIDITAGESLIDIDVESSVIEVDVVASEIDVTVDASVIDIDVEASVIEVELSGTGQQGPPGEPSSATDILEAGETISALKPVVVLDGIAFVASSSDSDHRGFVAGVAITAATVGNDVTVKTSGRITDSSWNWNPLIPSVFVGDGVLTQTPPSSGWVQAIARVEASDTIVVHLNDVYARV